MSNQFQMSADQKAFYEANGYLLVKGLLTRDEAAELRAEAHAVVSRLSNKGHSTEATWSSVRDDQSQKKTSISHCHDVQFHSAAFTRLFTDPRLMGIAQGIIGPNVQLHHSKLFIKPPENGSPFPMHQDCPYFPHQKHSMIAAIIHFDAAPIAKGCLRVVPGSHKLGLIPTTTSDHSLPKEKWSVETSTPVEAEPGDVVFFSYLTIHGSGINSSTEARTTVLLQMRDPADPPSEITHESRGQGMMLAGIDPTAGFGARARPDGTPATGHVMGMGMGMEMGGR